MIRVLFTYLLTLCVCAAVDFEQQVLPILEKKCFECHSSRAEKPKGRVAFDNADGLARVAKRTDWEWVLEVVKLPQHDGDAMPPMDEGEPLNAEEIALLENWIAGGANIGGFTAYEHPKPQLVSGLGAKQVATETKAAAAEIDRLVGAALEKKGLARNPEIEDANFMRRVYLEIAGRNPTLAEAESFLSSKGTDKRAILVDMLMDSDGYVSHHFNYWTKVLRAETDQGGNEQDAWLQYLKRSIATNTRYDKWTREMMTAEGRVWDDPAIGFFLRDAKNRLAGYEAMTNVFLGTEIGCAQCHDHPTRPLSQLSYYKMEGFYETSYPFGGTSDTFENISRGDYVKSLQARQKHVRDNKIGRRERENQILRLGNLSAYEFGKKITAEDNTGRSRVPSTYRYDDVEHNSYLHPEPLFGIAPVLKKTGEKPMHVFADWVTDPQNLKFTYVIANRMWLKVMGTSLLGSPTDILPVEKSEFPELAEHLSELMLACEFDLKKFQTILFHTRTYQSKAVASATDENIPVIQGPPLRRLSAEQIWDSFIAMIREVPDPPAAGPSPDFSNYITLRSAKTAEEYWKLVEDRLDYEIEHNVGIVGGSGDVIRSSVRTKREGFDRKALVRASELPSPAPEGHYLQVFGQGRRIVIEDEWETATVPQALMLLNGNLHDVIATEDSALSRALGNMSDQTTTIRRIFLASLARYPDENDFALARQVTSDGSRESYLQLLWILLNTTEYILQS